MPHLRTIINTQSNIWIRRFEEDNFHPWKEFMNSSLKKLKGNDILNRKLPIKLMQGTDMSDFNKEVLLNWNKPQKPLQNPWK